MEKRDRRIGGGSFIVIGWIGTQWKLLHNGTDTAGNMPLYEPLLFTSLCGVFEHPELFFSFFPYWIFYKKN